MAPVDHVDPVQQIKIDLAVLASEAKNSADWRKRVDSKLDAALEVGVKVKNLDGHMVTQIETTQEHGKTLCVLSDRSTRQRVWNAIIATPIIAGLVALAYKYFSGAK